MAYTQDFFSSRRNENDGNTRIGDEGRLWYDSNTNTIRVSDASTPGGVIVGGGGSGGGALQGSSLQPITITTPSTQGTTLALSGGNSTGSGSDGGDLTLIGGDGASGTDGDIFIGATQTGNITIGSGSNNVDFPSGTSVDFTGATVTGLSSGASVTISDDAPGSPSAGDLWWESDTGKLKIYYSDTDSNQWVDASPSGGGGLSAVVDDTTPQLGGNLDAQSTYKIVNLVDPTAAQDAATKAYVDASGGGGSSLQSRTTKDGVTGFLIDGGQASVDITGFKGYALLKVYTSRAARVRIYTDDASRTADASRAEGTDPTADAGVVAEVITTTANETVLISPGAFGFNNESTPTTTIPTMITNKSGSTQAITVTLTLLQLES